MDTRKDWDHYFMDIARVVLERSNCRTRQVGCVIVRGRQIISTGYNGTPAGIKNCFDGGCTRCAQRTKQTSGMALDECVCSHAEENAVVQSAKNGISTLGCTLYTTLNPCLTCAKIIINSGITDVFLQNPDYAAAHLTVGLFKEAGINVTLLKNDNKI